MFGRVSLRLSGSVTRSEASEACGIHLGAWDRVVVQLGSRADGGAAAGGEFGRSY